MKTNIAFLSLWVWVEIEGFRDCWICILQLWSCWFIFLIRNLSSHLNLTSLSIGKFSPCQLVLLLLTMSLFSFLALCFESFGDSKWWMLFISIIISMVLMLMTTFAHITTCTQFGKQWPPPHWLWHQKMFTIWIRLVYLIYLRSICLVQGKVCGCKIHKDRLTLALFVNTTCTYTLKVVIIY